MKALIELRKRHFLLFDTLVATLVAAAAIVIALVVIGSEHAASQLNGVRTTLYGTASAGCGALLGFVITTTTITDVVMQNPQWEAFRKSLAYFQVQDIYFNTMRWLGVSTLLFLVFLVADTDMHPLLACEVVSVWLVCMLTVRMWRSIGALEKLLRRNSFKKTDTLAR